MMVRLHLSTMVDWFSYKEKLGNAPPYSTLDDLVLVETALAEYPQLRSNPLRWPQRCEDSHPSRHSSASWRTQQLRTATRYPTKMFDFFHTRLQWLLELNDHAECGHTADVFNCSMNRLRCSTSTDTVRQHRDASVHGEVSLLQQSVDKQNTK